MPYVMERHDAEYTSVSGLGEAPYTAPKNTSITIPDKTRITLIGRGFATTTKQISATLTKDAIVDRDTGKLLETAQAILAQSAIMRDTEGRYIPIGLDTRVEVPKLVVVSVQPSTQPAAPTLPYSSTDPFPSKKTVGSFIYYRIYTNSSRTPLHQPLVTDYRPPYNPANYVVAEDLTAGERASYGLPVTTPSTPTPPVAARPTVGDPVKAFQRLVGTDDDGKYGQKTHSKGHDWAKANASDKAASFKRNGPVAIESELEAKIPGIDIEALQAAYKRWKRTQVSAPPPATVTPEMVQETTRERAQSWEDVQRAGIGLWLGDNWWILAAVAVVSVGGYIVWKRYKTETPELPASFVTPEGA